MWTINVCEGCQFAFAVKVNISDLCCPYCCSDEILETGELLSEKLYNSQGKEI